MMKVKVGENWENWGSGGAAKVDVNFNQTLSSGFTDEIWTVLNLVSVGTSLNNTFNGMSMITTVPYFDTSNVTNMSGMFQNCYSLTTIPSLDTSKVTNMTNMFYGCTSLTAIPNLDTSKVNSMTAMFYGCSSLQEVPALNMSAVTSNSNIFGYTSAGNLTSLTRMRAFGSKRGFIIHGTKMDATAINEVFQNLGTAYNASQTIDVRNNPGSLDCDPSIATAKGFIVQR